MIRKQLYITEAQERALKRRASEEGRSEAAVARQALGVHLFSESAARPGAATEGERQEALGSLLEETRRLAKGRRLKSDFRERYRAEGRSVLYEERMRRVSGASQGEDVALEGRGAVGGAS